MLFTPATTKLAKSFDIDVTFIDGTNNLLTRRCHRKVLNKCLTDFRNYPKLADLRHHLNASAPEDFTFLYQHNSKGIVSTLTIKLGNNVVKFYKKRK